jgi:pimeloyl-ACP methyl ester carboxylesterase
MFDIKGIWRADVLRWTRRIALGALVLAALTVFGGVAYERLSRWAADRAYPPIGELVELDGMRSHLNCEGDGEPTVILEAGWSGGGSLDWTLVQPELSELTRTCSYDRAGILWSERRRGPRDASRIAEELHGLLRVAGEAPPYVMVGHSLGGPLVRVFDARFPGKVVGFVFVDASHPDQYERLPPEARGSLLNPFWRRLRAATGLHRLRTRPPGYGLPSEAGEVVQHLMPRSVAALTDEQEAVDEILRQAGEGGPLGNRPLVVLTASNHARPGMRQAAIVDAQRAWLALQLDLAALSSNSVQRTVEGAHHYIQLAKPEAVVDATRNVVTAVRDGTGLTEDRAGGAVR